MKKINKTKLIAIIVIAVLIITSIILGIILNNSRKTQVNELGSKAGSISSAYSEFEALKVRDVELSYSEEIKGTIVAFVIENKTDVSVDKSTIQIQLLSEKEKLLGISETYVETIDANGIHPINMMLAGNIQGIKKIKLVNANKEETSVE